MSDAFDKAVDRVRATVAGKPVEGSYKFVLEDEGTILIDNGTVTTEDAEADVTVKASLETFRAMFDGELDPAAAFMSGQLEIQGDMAAAMRLAELVG